MDAKEAIALIERIMDRPLNEIQKLVVTKVIENKSYQEIAIENNSYAEIYIKQTGSDLWRSLSRQLSIQLNTEVKVTKNRLTSTLLWYLQQQQQERDLPPSQVNVSRYDWGEEEGENTEKICFYGREEELQTLQNCCVTENCRLICVLGMRGMGKSTLVRRFVDSNPQLFDRVIRRSLLHSPVLTDLVEDLLQFLAAQTTTEFPSSFAERLELLISHLKQYRCLIILDDIESILQPQTQAGQYRCGYDDYALLWRAIASLQPQSCLILLTSEKPQDLGILETTYPAVVKTLHLDGLKLEEAHQLVQDYGAPQFTPEIWQGIHNHYGGNPLALKIATIAAADMARDRGRKIQDLVSLLDDPYYRFDRIEDSMSRQLDRLSEVEKQIVYCLAISREPISITDISQYRLTQIPHKELLTALQSLQRRCVTIRPDRLWSLQPVMMEYVTNRLITEIIDELSPIKSDNQDFYFAQVNNHSIVPCEIQDRRHQTQIRTLVHPLLRNLIYRWQSREQLEEFLLEILQFWESFDPVPSGHLGENIALLLRELNNISD
jgi:hypothetical protein